MAVIMWPISWSRYQDEDHFMHSVVIGQLSKQEDTKHAVHPICVRFTGRVPAKSKQINKNKHKEAEEQSAIIVNIFLCPF